MSEVAYTHFCVAGTVGTVLIREVVLYSRCPVSLQGGRGGSSN